MKKQLLSILILFTLFVSSFSFAQQNRTANVSASGTHTFKKSAPNAKTNLLAVPNTTTSTCMSINLPAPATWSLVNYGTGTPIFADGFVNGPNIYGDKEKAMYFDASASANTMITQVYVGFDHAYSATPTKTVAVKFYDGTSGTPGASIGQGTLSMATIMTDVTNNQYSLIIFPTPLTLPASKRFFASVDVSALSFTTAIKDSLSIVSNTDLQTIPTQAWEKWSTNAWYKYDNVNSWQLDISLLIHPFLTQAPIVASITVPTGTLCTGTSISYNSAGSTAGTYDWFFTGATTATATGATANTTYTSAGTYTTQMIVEDACGSFGIATKTINVNPTPAPLVTSNSPVCLGSPINLGVATIAGASYQWSGPNAFSSGTQNPSIPSASVINSGVYTGSATVLGCTGTSSVMVNITTPTTSASNTGPFCVGTTINLNCPSATSYTWSGPNAFTSNLQNPTISNATLPMSGIYTLMVTSSSCTATAVTMVTVNTATTSASNTGPYCVGSTIQLNSPPVAVTYTWTGPSAFNSNSQNPTIFSAALANSGTYTIIITAANTCTAQATTSVTVNSLPNPAWSSNSPVCVGQAINFTGSGGTTYTWTGPSSFNSNVQSPTIPVSSLSNSGTYTLTVTDANGCTNFATASVTVSACTGINNVSENIAQFVVYPNPNNGDFTISVTGLDKTPSVEIYNAIGKLVYSDVLTTEKNTFNTNLAAGIYFINVIENNKVIASQKLICK